MSGFLYLLLFSLKCSIASKSTYHPMRYWFLLLFRKIIWMNGSNLQYISYFEFSIWIEFQIVVNLTRLCSSKLKLFLLSKVLLQGTRLYHYYLILLIEVLLSTVITWFIFILFSLNLRTALNSSGFITILLSFVVSNSLHRLVIFSVFGSVS